MVSRSAKIIHARVDSRQLGADYPIDLPIVADVKETARYLVEAVKATVTKDRLAKIKQARWDATKSFTDKMQQSYLTAARDGWDESPLTWPRLLLTVNEMLDEDAIIVEELGTEDWVQRSFPFADGKKTDGGDDDVDTAEQRGNPERESGLPALKIDPDQPDTQAQHR